MKYYLSVSLAELIKQFFEDENGSGWTEDDERLSAEQTEDGSCQSSAKKTLHHSLRERDEEDG